MNWGESACKSDSLILIRPPYACHVCSPGSSALPRLHQRRAYHYFECCRWRDRQICFFFLSRRCFFRKFLIFPLNRSRMSASCDGGTVYVFRERACLFCCSLLGVIYSSAFLVSLRARLCSWVKQPRGAMLRGLRVRCRETLPNDKCAGS